MSDMSLYSRSPKDLLARSHEEALLARSLHKISMKGLLVKISLQDLLDYQNEHRATTRAIWDAQDVKRIARAHVGFGQDIAQTAKKDPWKSQKKLFTQVPATFCQGLQSIAPAQTNAPEAFQVLHLPHRISIMSQIKFKRCSDLSKRRPSSPHTAPARKNHFQNKLSIWPMPTNLRARCNQCRATWTEDETTWNEDHGTMAPWPWHLQMWPHWEKKKILGCHDETGNLFW